MRLIKVIRVVLVVLAAVVGLASSATMAQQHDLPLLELSPVVEESGTVASLNDYAAMGVLRRVRNEATQAERLAVVGDDGQMQAFLAPTARLNLRRYLGKPIGVTAKSMTDDGAGPPTIIVDRVVLLSTGATRTGTGQPRAAGMGDAVGTAVRHVDFAEPVVSDFADPARHLAPPTNIPRTAGVRVGNVHATPSNSVRTVQHEVMVPQEVVVGDDWGVSGGDEILAGASCSSCTTGTCSTAACGEVNCRHCGSCSVCGPPGWMWVRGEYMLLWANGMRVPPLVTRGGATAGVAGVLGQPDTEILLGNEDILLDGRSGFRIRFGGYLGPRRRLMWEGEYFGTGTGVYDFLASSDGNGSPALARPFFNINPRDPDTGELISPATQDSELVSFPGILAGSVSVDVDSEIKSAGGRLRWNICCREMACARPNCNTCCGPGIGPSGYTKLDFLAGYRYMGLKESLIVREDLTTLTAPAGRFEIFDSFRTRNEFHGGEVGFLWEGGWRRWTLECLSKVALGNVHQVVDINGGTTFSPLTSPQQTFTGGLLAQSSNIGRYTQDEFGVLPELGVTLGLHLTPRLRATVGYTFVFLSPVLRPGDQISLDVNPDLLPPQIDPVEGPLRPEFAFRETDLWANALNVGLDLRW